MGIGAGVRPSLGSGRRWAALAFALLLPVAALWRPAPARAASGGDTCPIGDLVVLNIPIDYYLCLAERTAAEAAQEVGQCLKQQPKCPLQVLSIKIIGG